MNENKKTIIWLEDNPDLFKPINTVVESSIYNIKRCASLLEFKEVTDAYADKPELVKGFIIDVLLQERNLADLGMKGIGTNNGVDTGFKVLLEFLRNVQKQNPAGDIWKSHRVLMLSVLKTEYMDSRYGKYQEYEREHFSGLTIWLSKGDEYGDFDQTKERILKWLN